MKPFQLVLMGAFLGMAPTASAVLVAYDPFLSGADRPNGQYTAGVDIRTQGPSVFGWPAPAGTHAGTTSNFLPNAAGENSSSVDYEQGGRLQWVGVSGSPLDRNVSRPLSPQPSSSEWWFSIIVNRGAWSNVTTPNSNTYAVGGFITSNGNGLQVGYEDQTPTSSSVPDLVFRYGGTNLLLESDVAANTSRFVLVKLDINTTGLDTVSIWNSPASLGSLGVANFIRTDVNVSDSLTPFTASKYQTPGQSGPTYFDEIRLATDFTSIAVPEPSASMLAVAGLGLLRRRRN